MVRKGGFLRLIYIYIDSINESISFTQLVNELFWLLEFYVLFYVLQGPWIPREFGVYIS